MVRKQVLYLILNQPLHRKDTTYGLSQLHNIIYANILYNYNYLLFCTSVSRSLFEKIVAIKLEIFKELEHEKKQVAP